MLVPKVSSFVTETGPWAPTGRAWGSVHWERVGARGRRVSSSESLGLAGVGHASFRDVYLIPTCTQGTEQRGGVHGTHFSPTVKSVATGWGHYRSGSLPPPIMSATDRWWEVKT